ncbi:hypothetical protein RHMOL_Rhmol02G0106000 [Rhododendron molle]|uniref:Uncharacterized protein n=1 Tax=Rhododendron molle TaxID=49168 RepID=A0ACC0PNH4_RHOML|nr:hypothetical protein RHMOL_Rhmol02G0106000 [Rhododendron molle]
MKKKTIVSNDDTKGSSIQRVNLPPEILADILSRLSVKFLCQLKCVSPSWNSLISSPYFAKTHLKRNPPSQRIILVCDSEDLYSVDFADENPAAEKLDFPSVQYSHKWQWVKVLGSCNGLLLVYGQGHSQFLLNPSTRERKKLPDYPSSFILDLICQPFIYLHGFGYDSSTDDYKAVMLSCRYNISGSRFYCDWDGNITYVFVYSLKTDAWRRIQGSHCRPLECCGRPSGVYFNERLHWLCKRSGDSDGSLVIVAFDLSDEIFREVPTLFSYSMIWYHRMAVLGGCLCVIVYTPSFCNELWMMKEYGVRDSWTKFTITKFAINTETVLVDWFCLLAEDEILLKTRTKGNLLEEVDQDELVVYNRKKKIVRDMVVRGIPPKCQYGGTYVESLVSPNHGGGMGRNE